MGGGGRQGPISRGVTGLLIFVLLVAGPAPVAGGVELPPADGIRRYAQLVRLYPGSAPCHNALGYYYFRVGDLKEAETWYLKALEIDRSYAVAHNNIGIVYLHQRKPEVAEAHFRQALAFSPAYVKARYNVAVALFRQRRYIDAVKAYLVARNEDWKYVRGRDDPAKMKAALEEANKDPETRQELERIRREYTHPN